MPIGLLKDIVQSVPQDRALLGMDVGAKTIGLALASPGLSLATPLQTIKRVKFSRDMEALVPLVKEFDIGGFIIGLPVHMDGEEGRRAQSIRDFALEMKNYPQVVGTDPWIAFWDERLSTASVEEFVDNSVEKRKTRVDAKSSGLIDRLAAQHILQGALDYLAHNN